MGERERLSSPDFIELLNYNGNVAIRIYPRAFLTRRLDRILRRGIEINIRQDRNGAAPVALKK